MAEDKASVAAIEAGSGWVRDGGAQSHRTLAFDLSKMFAVGGRARVGAEER